MIQAHETDYCVSLEERLSKQELTQEAAKQNMTFSSICKSMVPSVVIGSIAAMGGQDLASKCTNNPECVTVAGMAAQYIGGWIPFVYLHYQNNKHRLRKQDGKIDFHTFGQDLSAVLASDQVGNKIWATSYVLTNELSLRNGIDPASAGLISGISSATLYTLFTGYTAPKVNTAINYIKGKLKSWRKN